jgi:DnaA family protein
MRQIPLAIAPPSPPSFDNFTAGDNAQALLHLRQLEPPAPPVYLWGPQGSGKTHLLRALAGHWQAQGRQVGCFGPGDAPPWTPQPHWAAVLVDDCEALDADRQQAAFALFVEAGSLGVQWVAAGRLPPVDLPLRDDLRTRLGWGHVFALQPLAEPQARATLRREADHRGIFLSDEVMDYLLTRFERDLKHLMALLDRLDTFALAEGRAVTVPLLKKMLAEESGVERAA